MSLLDRTLEHLRELVSFDTRNPPRQIDGGGIFEYLREQLEPGCDVEITELGDGCVSLWATRGDPRYIFNFHVDTVPVAQGWESEPFQLSVEDGRATGLGACDIKGASAAMLAAIERTSGPVALLFTSDEEAGQSRCVRTFLDNPVPAAGVFVAEPTSAKAVLEHRGICTGITCFEGISGHASSGKAATDSAVHHAVEWCCGAMEVVRRHDDDDPTLPGLLFNIGRIEGGVKPNMIAGECEVRWGFRPGPDVDVDVVLEALRAAEPEEARASWTPGFRAPALPPTGAALVPPGMELGPPVDFWTEAALFAAAGYSTIVFGPGNIEQAHTADEWVPLDDLEEVARRYVELIGS